jgi:hypothetical protein
MLMAIPIIRFNSLSSFTDTTIQTSACQGTAPFKKFSWEDWRVQWKISVRIIGYRSQDMKQVSSQYMSATSPLCHSVGWLEIREPVNGKAGWICNLIKLWRVCRTNLQLFYIHWEMTKRWRLDRSLDLVHATQYNQNTTKFTLRRRTISSRSCGSNMPMLHTHCHLCFNIFPK